MASVFRTALEFLDRLGVYDVLLPFILVFTIVFAILEKTKVLGVEKQGKTEMPRRNLNSLIAFVIGFFVVASSQLVATINQALAHVVILLLIVVCFLMLVGAFHKEGAIYLDGMWKKTWFWIMFVGVILIFANAIPTKSGVSVLEWLWGYAVTNWDGTVVGTIIFLILIIAGVVWVTRTPKEGGSTSEAE